jgi:hypothetical protein
MIHAPSAWPEQRCRSGVYSGVSPVAVGWSSEIAHLSQESFCSLDSFLICIVQSVDI